MFIYIYQCMVGAEGLPSCCAPGVPSPVYMFRSVHMYTYIYIYIRYIHIYDIYICIYVCVFMYVYI